MARGDGRLANQPRPVKIVTGFLRGRPSSVLIETGSTRVVRSATAEELELAGSGIGKLVRFQREALRL